jgi:hypothetical protein
MDQSVTTQETKVDVTPANSKSRVVLLITLLNVILLGGLLYKTFARAVTPSGGVMLILINDTFVPLVDLTLQGPGDQFKLARLEPGGQVGTSVKYGSEFEAALAFKDDEGHAYEEKFTVTPVGEFKVVIYIEPQLEEVVTKSAEGREETLLKASQSRVRVITTYQGDRTKW